MSRGGLWDKLWKPRDFYHSCYNLSGLSVAQYALEPWPPMVLLSVDVVTKYNGKAKGGGSGGGTEEDQSFVWGHKC